MFLFLLVCQLLRWREKASEIINMNSQSRKNIYYDFLTDIPIIAGLVIATVLILSLYFILKAAGVEKNFNIIDKSVFVPWRQQGFYPKQYFKLFYNLSIILIPIMSVFFAFFIGKMVSQPYRVIKKKILRMTPEKKSKSSFIEKYYLVILIIMLTVVLINFGYLLETGIWVNYYHHNFIIAVVNDLFHGKHLLVDTFSQYGLLYPWFLSLFFKRIFFFSYMNLYLLFMILTWVYFFTLFFFLKALIKNKLYALIGLYVIMGVNMLFNYSTYPFSENYVWPGGIPLRFFFDGSVFFLIIKNEHFTSRWIHILTVCLIVVAALHNIETGLALVVSVLFLYFIYSLSFKKIDLLSRICFFLVRFAYVAAAGIGVWALFSIYTRLGAGQWPDWYLFTRFMRLAQQGLNNAQTPIIGWYWLHLLLYFAVLTVVLDKIIRLKTSISWRWIVVTAYSFYGLLLLNYYMSRSYDSNLTVVSIPAVVILIFLIKELVGQRWVWLRRIRFALILIVVVLAYFTSFYLYKRLGYRWYALHEVQKAKKYLGNRGFVMVSYNEEGDYTVENLLKSVNAIKTLTHGAKKILLLSRYDALILIMTGKTHIVSYPITELIFYRTELEGVKNNLAFLKTKPLYLFIDKKNPAIKDSEIIKTSFWTAREIFKELSPFYEFVTQVGILDIYKLKEF